MSGTIRAFAGALLLIHLLAAGLPATAPAAAKADARKQLREARDIRVTMYMTRWCAYCKEARAHLRSLGVTLTEYDIEEDDAKRKEMKKLSGGSTMVPLIDVEGIVIRGFSPDEIDDAVAARRKAK
ncbi:MAG: hypothetical protein OHK006_23920 [Thermodesulfovibrionales bacterium]